MTLSLAVLASGQGTNLQAILDAIGRKELDARLCVVLSDNPDAYALVRAEKHGIPHETVVRKNFPDKAAFEGAFLKILKERGAEWVALAGFMRLLSPAFVRAYPGRILNIHPSLLPAFPGLDSIRQAFDHGARVSGCTVHLVDEGCDTGPIVAQAAVPIEPHDTLETLTEKVHREEHRLYPLVLQWAAEGKIVVEGRRVRIR